MSESIKGSANIVKTGLQKLRILMMFVVRPYISFDRTTTFIYRNDVRIQAAKAS